MNTDRSISVTSRLFDDEDQPVAWPVCAECKTPYAYRWAMRFPGKSGFMWFRDCKHKTAEVETHTKEQVDG